MGHDRANANAIDGRKRSNSNSSISAAQYADAAALLVLSFFASRSQAERRQMCEPWAAVRSKRKRLVKRNVQREENKARGCAKVEGERSGAAC